MVTAPQRAVVAAWLLVKEASATLALLVDMAPPPSDPLPTPNPSVRPSPGPGASPGSGANPGSGPSSSPSLGASPCPLSIQDIANVGHVILDALGRLKHMG